MRTKDIKLIIDKDLDRNKDIKNHLFFVSFDSATVSLTVIRYLIEYAASSNVLLYVCSNHFRISTITECNSFR